MKHVLLFIKPASGLLCYGFTLKRLLVDNMQNLQCTDDPKKNCMVIFYVVKSRS